MHNHPSGAVRQLLSKWADAQECPTANERASIAALRDAMRPQTVEEIERQLPHIYQVSAFLKALIYLRSTYADVKAARPVLNKDLNDKDQQIRGAAEKLARLLDERTELARKAGVYYEGDVLDWIATAARASDARVFAAFAMCFEDDLQRIRRVADDRRWPTDSDIVRAIPSASRRETYGDRGWLAQSARQHSAAGDFLRSYKHQVGRLRGAEVGEWIKFPRDFELSHESLSDIAQAVTGEEDITPKRISDLDC